MFLAKGGGYTSKKKNKKKKQGKKETQRNQVAFRMDSKPNAVERVRSITMCVIAFVLPLALLCYVFSLLLLLLLFLYIC